MARDNFTTEGYHYTVRRSRFSGEGIGRIVVSSIFVLFLGGLIVGGVFVAKRMDDDAPRVLPTVEAEQASLNSVMPDTPVGSPRFLAKDDLGGDHVLGLYGPCDPGELSGARAYADRWFGVPDSIAINLKRPEERVGVGLAIWSFRSGDGGELGFRSIRSAIANCGGVQPKGANPVPETQRSVVLDVDSVAAHANGSTLRYVVARWDRWVVVGMSSMPAEAFAAATRGIQTVEQLDQLLSKATTTTVAAG